MISLSEFIHKNLKEIADTYPLVAPSGTELPFIIYGLEGQEVTEIMSGSDVIKNFVTVTAYHKEYDDVMTLAKEIQEKLTCALDVEPNIIGVTYTSKGSAYDAEPIAGYNATLEFNIYER